MIGLTGAVSGIGTSSGTPYTAAEEEKINFFNSGLHHCLEEIDAVDNVVAVYLRVFFTLSGATIKAAK